jgi:hypothetical protein
VRIAGYHLSRATAVSFGAARARSFTVHSSSLITAISPAGAPGRVDITVTTAGGRSHTSTADRFTFTQVCVVPKLKGKKLKAARRALKRAHCRLGKVRPKGQKKGRVKRQSRRPGKVLLAGTKVNVRLG